MTTTTSTIELKKQHAHIDQGWDTIPIKTFSEVHANVTQAELKKRDCTLTRDALRLDEELRLDGIPLTDHALRQFASIAQVPPGVLALREIGETPRLAEVLNTHMEAGGNGKSPCIVRLRPDKQQEQVVRAVFDKIPIFFDAVHMLDLLADTLGKSVESAIFPRVNTNGDIYALKMFLADDVATARDTSYGRGLAIHINEVGGGTSLNAFTFDHACLNGMISTREQKRLKIVKQRGAIDYAETGKELQRGMEVLATAGKDLLRQMDYAYDIPVPSPPQTIARLVKDHHLTESEGRLWFDGYIEETAGRLQRPKNSAFSIVNGLNRGAQTLVDPMRRDELEALTVTVLAPFRGASAEEMRSHWEGINRRAAKLPESEYIRYQWLSRN